MAEFFVVIALRQFFEIFDPMTSTLIKLFFGFFNFYTVCLGNAREGIFFIASAHSFVLDSFNRSVPSAIDNNSYSLSRIDSMP